MDLAQNSSLKSYAAYFSISRGSLYVVPHAFLDWARLHTMRAGKVVRRVTAGKTMAIGVRFCFELLDNYLCQFCVMFFSHSHEHDFLSRGDWAVSYSKFFVGAMTYLDSLCWDYQPADRDHARDERLLVPRGSSLYNPDAFPCPCLICLRNL